MPKLPRSSLADVSPVQNRRVVNQENRASGVDPMGAQMADTGSAVFELTSKIREAHITAEVANAQNDLRLRLDSEYRALQADNGPPEELEAKFAERSKAVLSETSQGMSSPMHKRLFEAQSAELANAYTIKTRDLKRQKQLDGARALVMRNQDQLRETAANPDIERDVLEANHATTLDNARQQHRVGVLNDEQFAEAEIRINTALKSGISIRNVKTIEDYIDAGDPVSIAKAELLLADDKDNKFRSEILPEKREALDDVLKVKAEESTAYAQADKFWTDSGMNEGEALASARATIKDIDTLKTTEARIRQLASDKTAVQTTDEKEATDEGWRVIVGGGGLSNIPASVAQRIPGATLRMMQNEVESRADRARRYQEADANTRRDIRNASTTAYNELLAMAEADGELFAAGPMAWAAQDPLMAATYSALTEMDAAKLQKEVEKRRTGGGSTDAVTSIYKDMAAQLPFMAPDNLKAKHYDDIGNAPGLPGEGKKKKSKPEMELDGILFGLATEEAARNPGAKLTPQRSRELAALAFAEFGQKRDGSTKYPIAQDLGVAIAGRDIHSAAIAAARENPRVYAEARRIALQANPEATEADILMRHEQILARTEELRKPPVFSQGDR